MQILWTFRVFRYYLNTQILTEYLNAKFKAFKLLQLEQGRLRPLWTTLKAYYFSQGGGNF